MSSNLTRPLAVALSLVSLAACGEGASPGDPAGGRDGGASARNAGVLTGDVYFIGTPCPLIYPPRPPCDGPYPGYEVIVQRSDGREAARTRSDSVARYRVELEAGDYVIFTPDGIDPAIQKRNEAHVAAGGTTTLDLVVDTGIR